MSVPEARSVLFVEDGEAHAIKSNEPFLRAEPEIAVFCLSNRVHRVLGKALLCPPGIVRVLADDLPGLEGETGGRDQPERAEHSCGSEPDVCRAHSECPGNCNLSNRRIPPRRLAYPGRG